MLSRVRPDALERVSPEFRLEVLAVPDDIDELGHVSNLVYVRYVQEAAKAHSLAVGWSYEAYLKLGAVFVVRKHDIEYLAPAYAGDRIVLTTFVASWSAATSVRRTRIARAGDGKELARASTLWALVSTESGRPRRIPIEVRDSFAQLF